MEMYKEKRREAGRGFQKAHSRLSERQTQKIVQRSASRISSEKIKKLSEVCMLTVIMQGFVK